METYDVAIVGAGLAGLTLCRHLLLHTDKTVLLLDKRNNPPREAPQKYGESLVQCAGYYFSKVLDLEEYLLINHYLKYNLRFYWPTEGLDQGEFENYSQLFVRSLSNIPTFQLDRNLLEEFLLESNRTDPRCRFLGGVKNMEAELSSDGGQHRLRFQGQEISCSWVVDASGRGQVLKRNLGLTQQNPVRHNATFCWVEGLVNVEKLTSRSRTEVIYNSARRYIGHFPFFLLPLTSALRANGFWVIPLHHKTSLGLVYDSSVLDPEEVSNTRKLFDYVCRTWPLFERDLRHRKVLDEGRLIDFSHGCRQTISADRWALVGEAGRFSDPLYSPGSDLISIYNSLIVDAIQTNDRAALAPKCELAERIEQVMYEAYIPSSHARSYDCLGDPEAFALKYAWELAVYFGFYVFPMINNLYVKTDFMAAFLRRFAVLGSINRNLHALLSNFFQWKRQQPRSKRNRPRFVELFRMKPVHDAEKMFYQVTANSNDALAIMDAHLQTLEQFARYIIASVHAAVLSDPGVLLNAAFVSTLNLRQTEFNPAAMRSAYAKFKNASEPYRWEFDPLVLNESIGESETAPMAQPPWTGWQAAKL